MLRDTEASVPRLVAYGQITQRSSKCFGLLMLPFLWQSLWPRFFTDNLRRFRLDAFTHLLLICHSPLSHHPPAAARQSIRAIGQPVCWRPLKSPGQQSIPIFFLPVQINTVQAIRTIVMELNAWQRGQLSVLHSSFSCTTPSSGRDYTCC